MRQITIISKVILLLILVLVSSSCESQLDSQKLAKSSDVNKYSKIDEIIRLFHKYGGFNGSALVSYKGELLYKKGFGYANMEWKIPNNTNTKFQIASVSKQFTAMLILQLVHEGKLDLHAPISEYLPDYPSKAGNAITLHHLLTHSSGIPNVQSEKDAFRPKEIVEQFSKEALLFSPGERFDYSNSGYNLLGYIIEVVTGESFGAILQEKICKPLNMNNTGLYTHRPIIENMSSGYYKSWGEYYDVDHSDKNSAYSAGGIYSTVEDMYKWDKALYTESLLPKKYLDLLFSKHIEDPSIKGHYGYGWETRNQVVGNTDTTIEVVGHGGSISGYRSCILRIPSLEASVVLFSNTSYAFLLSMNKAIVGILQDETYDLPLKPLAQFMAEKIQEKGVEEGIQYYREHVDQQGYYISEQELIIEGYRFLHAGNAEDASKIFKLSIEIFPDRDNPYDSYAESLMVLGRNEEAIENYEKSLELNPNNNNAKKMLEKLRN